MSHSGTHNETQASSSGTAASGIIAGNFPRNDGMPYFLHGWNFLRLVRSDDREALAFKASAQDAGPVVVINPMFVSPEDLESPAKAILWLSSALTHICYVVLLECMASGDRVGRFTSPAWLMFRTEACAHACMEWDEIISAARREGVDFMAEHLAACLFVESGLQDQLFARIDGQRRLKIASA